MTPNKPKKRKTDRMLNLFGEWIEFFENYLSVDQQEMKRVAGLGQSTITHQVYAGGSLPAQKTMIRLWIGIEKIAHQQGLTLSETWRIAFFHAAGLTTEQDQQSSLHLLRCLKGRADVPDLNS